MTEKAENELITAEATALIDALFLGKIQTDEDYADLADRFDEDE